MFIECFCFLRSTTQSYYNRLHCSLLLFMCVCVCYLNNAILAVMYVAVRARESEIYVYIFCLSMNGLVAMIQRLSRLAAIAILHTHMQIIEYTSTCTHTFILMCYCFSFPQRKTPLTHRSSLASHFSNPIPEAPCMTTKIEFVQFEPANLTI